MYSLIVPASLSGAEIPKWEAALEFWAEELFGLEWCELETAEREMVREAALESLDSESTLRAIEGF